MKMYFQIVTFLFITASVGCKSYSKYTIDEKPMVKIDTNLPGIWKVVEDTNRADCFIIQTQQDLYDNFLLTANKYKDEIPITGKDYLEAYKKYKENKNYMYYITRMDYNGTNPHYQQWHAFMSKVGGLSFLNIYYRYTPSFDNPQSTDTNTVKGFFFVRIIKTNEDHNAMTIAVVADKALKYLESEAEVRSRFKEKLNTPAFYSDTLHLYRVSKYHASLNRSKDIANPK